MMSDIHEINNSENEGLTVQNGLMRDNFSCFTFSSNMKCEAISKNNMNPI